MSADKAARKGGDKTKGKAKGKAGGKDKGGGKGPKVKKRVVRNHYVALVGLAGLGLIALKMLQGELDLVGAGRRALVVLGLVLLVERLVLPVCRSLVGPPAPPTSRATG